jgi:hypothetical protein
VISQVIGAPLAAGLLALDGVGNLDGWQWLFLAEGIPTLVFGMCGNPDAWPSVLRQNAGHGADKLRTPILDINIDLQLSLHVAHRLFAAEATDLGSHPSIRGYVAFVSVDSHFSTGCCSVLSVAARAQNDITLHTAKVSRGPLLRRYLGTTLAENPAKAKFLTPAEQIWLQRRNAAQKVRRARDCSVCSTGEGQ